MKKLFTLSALATFGLASLSAQAQFAVNGTLGATEVGTGVGKYQLLGTYTGTHTVTDRGLKAVYMGTTATTLNIMVVASPEIAGYNSLVLYLDMPNKTGIAAGTRLPGSNNNPNESLRQRPTLDMPVDYGFRITTSPFTDVNGGAMYLSRVDYTVAAPTNGYSEIGMGTNPKNGTVTSDTNDPAMAQSAFQTSATGSVAANTSTGWEFAIPLAAFGGAAVGSNISVMVGYIDDNRSFNADLLPQITGRTTALGIDPDFTLIAGRQSYTYQVGTGVLASRAATAEALGLSAHPNPLTSASALSYTVAGGSQPVRVEVYNALGQRVLSLLDAEQKAGTYQTALAPVKALAAGSYLVKLQVGTQLTSHRVVVE